MKIVIIQGHPDPAALHFGHALADAYDRGAVIGGHEVRRIEVSQLEFSWLRSQAEWNDGFVPASLREAQAAIGWADHLVLVFPLWLGTMPAMLKGLLEQVLRPGFAFQFDASRSPQKSLVRKTARVVVTMGLTSLRYRWFFRAHGVRGLERSILAFAGIGPIRETFIGSIEDSTPAARAAWLAKLETIGRAGK